MRKINLLVIYSGNERVNTTFIHEQIASLEDIGIPITKFNILGSGILGYLKNYGNLLKVIRNKNVNLIHTHYGFAGLLANLQRRVPVITTYHGTDINLKKGIVFSIFSIFLSKANIFVDPSQVKKLPEKKKSHVIPCGIDLDIFRPVERNKAREKMKFSKNDKIIIFSSRFSRTVKNYKLAKEAINFLNDDSIKLIELINYTREDVNLLLNAADVALLTSYTEGSPQFIKEAMACNIPIVSTDVGDVKWLRGSLKGFFITSFDYKDVAEKIKLALGLKERPDLRTRLYDLNLDNKIIATRLLHLYYKIL